jgi:5-methyltetrahydrofolate--homocysteine methyltransferase
MNRFLERLRSGEILVADGATGTNLQKVGLAAGTHTEDWVLDHPDKILELEKAFVAAGADILLTCTFGGTRPRLKGAGHAGEVTQINRRAVELAHEAASSRGGTLVAGSIGPIGQLLKPYGPITAEEAAAAFAEQAKALAEGGVDLLVIETHFALEEATAAFEGARSVTDLPIVVSFSYDRGVRTMMGVKPADVTGKYKALGAVMVGANCGTTLENMESVIREYAQAGMDLPLWAKPNAGMPRLEGAEAIYDVSPAQMSEFAKKYIASGARVVGGCCGSTPEHVAAIAREAKKVTIPQRHAAKNSVR